MVNSGDIRKTEKDDIPNSNRKVYLSLSKIERGYLILCYLGAKAIPPEIFAPLCHKELIVNASINPGPSVNIGGIMFYNAKLTFYGLELAQLLFKKKPK